MAAVLDQNKVPKIVYLYDPESNTPNLMLEDGKTYKLIQDTGLGSVRYVIDPEAKRIVQELEYDELGNLISNLSNDFQPLGYAGGLTDADTELIRFGARDYDSRIGRILQVDPHPEILNLPNSFLTKYLERIYSKVEIIKTMSHLETKVLKSNSKFAAPNEK